MNQPTPCRVDFAGGWLDVPAFAIEGAYVVNCAIQPLATLDNFPYERNAGLGDNITFGLLYDQERRDRPYMLLEGWQDRAVIVETGLCIWRSGPAPVLDCKVNPDFLNGLMALHYTGPRTHRASNAVNIERNYKEIANASQIAADAVRSGNLSKLAEAINLTNTIQLQEGMETLPSALRALAYKYLGCGHGGYALYLFADKTHRDTYCEKTGALVVEPFLKAAHKPKV